MKVNIFLNNFFPRYNKTPMDINEIKHAQLKHIKRAIKSDEHTYILRGEPTLYPYLYEVLDALQGKDFILSTSGFKPEILMNYKKKIPYLTINYDGFTNDRLRNNPELTRNILKLLDYFGPKKDMTTRITYTISKMNLDWIKADAEILVRFYELYPNLKKPYFVIYQQAEIYNQSVFTWVGLGKNTVNMLNSKGLLSAKNLAYMHAWMDKIDYDCKSPEDEMVLSWDGKFKMCMSMRFGEDIADIDNESFEDIVENTIEERRACVKCSYRSQCWLSFHFKENISILKNI